MSSQPDPRQIQTLGALRESGWRSRTVKEELRENLLARLSTGQPWLSGIVGYEETVLPQLENAILSQHNFILLGLRGQAKTRIVRQLIGLLDEWMPAVMGCPLRSDPYHPVSPQAKRRIAEQGDDAPIEWISRQERYHEKLATPDVTIADIIGDVDPIKAAREKIDLSDEGALHFGIIPRSNRGVFVMNELPDLQPRIQVGLLNILEEKDVQVRGFPIRIPLDILLSFTANPEDYTNRGNIITPLKDRIDSQILTHYPRTVDQAIEITKAEAWTDRHVEIAVPRFVDEILEQIAFTARESDYVDQSSGVSQRLPIRAHELLHSAVERRIIRNAGEPPVPRLADLAAVVPAITGRVELVYEGEQEGPQIVAHKLVGRAMLKVFERTFPKVYTSSRKKSRRETFGFEDEPRAAESRAEVPSDYREVLSFFSQGGRVELSDDMDWKTYQATLGTVPGLGKLVDAHKDAITKGHPSLSGDNYSAVKALAMEWVLECLHQVSLIAKQSKDGTIRFADMLANMLGGDED
ncbi:MAG: magnesium chelatase [Candidatus Eisenbacteria bacterium]|uniref:Magnesium chelatase n=1 Tax=Eiseniibacteriota bacterium TaxID=2212470 RepID=A0A956NH12_UNCEI|nr:magnesium chelatase [Candidatus Eisenbacteria bacterium]MCB9465637.1 magnesium chelatase [Candidatus Eisenbacteria bacterium]